MEGLRTAALAVCAASVAGGALRLLCPDGEMKNVYRTAIAVFLLCAVLSSAAKLDFRAAAASMDAALSGAGYTSGEDMTRVFREQVAGQVGARVRLTVEQALVDVGFRPQDIFVKVHCSGEGSIELEQITVRMNPEDRVREAEIKLCVERAAGLLPEVYYA